MIRLAQESLMPELDLRFAHAFDVRINFDKRWVIGPIPGGAKVGYTSVGEGSTVSGPRLNGKVVDYSGADWPTVRPDGVVELNAHYMIEADDGARIYIRNLGMVFDNVARSASLIGAGTQEAQEVANAMSSAWLAFARTGSPNSSGLPSWPPFNIEQRPTMVFNTVSRAVNDPLYRERKWLAPVTPAPASP